MFPYFVVFGRTVGTYAVCSAAGLIIAVAFFFVRTRRTVGAAFEDVVLMALVALAGITVGGHFLFGVTQIKKLILILKSLGRLPFLKALELIVNCFGGSVFYGGLFGSCLAGWIYMRVKKIAPKERRAFADAYACAIPLFHTFGRIGCFFGGCCYGIESEFGFTAHGNTLSPGVNDVNRFPVALLEASLNLLLFLFLLMMSRKGRSGGRLIFLYGLCYSVIRFSVEFLRGDEIRGIWYGLSTSQWISIALFAVCAAILIRARIKAARGLPDDRPDPASDPDLDPDPDADPAVTSDLSE